VRGDFEARGVKGELRVESVNGDAKVRQVSGAVALKSVRGDLAARDLDGGAVAEQVSGDVSLSTALAKGMSYRFQAKGDISAKVETNGGARLVLEGGDIHCRLPLQVSERSARRIVGTLGDGSAELALHAKGDLSVSDRGEGLAPTGEAQWESQMDAWTQQFSTHTAGPGKPRERRKPERRGTGFRVSRPPSPTTPPQPSRPATDRKPVMSDAERTAILKMVADKDHRRRSVKLLSLGGRSNGRGDDPAPDDFFRRSPAGHGARPDRRGRFAGDVVSRRDGCERRARRERDACRWATRAAGLVVGIVHPGG
jgi:hypothetical protein